MASSKNNKKKKKEISFFKKYMEIFQQTLVQAGIQKSVGEYLFKVSIPITLGGLGLGIVIGFIISGLFVLIISPIIGFILGLVFIFIYPFIVKDIRKEKINNALPILVTYMGGISTSKASRDQLFENVSKRESSFGIIALEIKRIVALATEWNFGYQTAVRKVAATTASSRFGDFLSRFSQALDAGEELEVYFEKEQESVLNSYISDYKRKIKSLEVLGDAFSALSTSLSFMSITFLLMMFLFGSEKESNTRNLLLILLVIQVVYIIMIVLFYVVCPKDDLISIQRKTSEYEKVLYTFLICIFIFMPILAFLTFVLKDSNGNNIISLPIFMIIFGIAMIYPGIVADDFEKLVKRRDENFPVFIRTLGGTTALLGGSIFESVNIISTEQFGPLTQDIKLLYTQSKFGIEPKVTWKWFSDSTSSSLIDRFLRIFISSMDIGGDVNIISKFISTNVEKILKLRKDRKQTIGVFKGTLLPLTTINIAIMIFMKDVLFLLDMTMGTLSEIRGMELYLGTPPDGFFINMYFTIYYLTMPLYACLTSIIPERGTWMKFTKYLSLYYILTGLEIIFVGKFSRTIMKGFGVSFEGIV